MCVSSHRHVTSQIGQAMQQEHEAGEKEQQTQLQDEAAFDLACAFYQPIHHTVPNTNCSQSNLPRVPRPSACSEHESWIGARRIWRSSCRLIILICQAGPAMREQALQDRVFLASCVGVRP